MDSFDEYFEKAVRCFDIGVVWTNQYLLYDHSFVDRCVVFINVWNRCRICSCPGCQPTVRRRKSEHECQDCPNHVCP